MILRYKPKGCSDQRAIIIRWIPTISRFPWTTNCHERMVLLKDRKPKKIANMRNAVIKKFI
jgi:hypothetical protein